MVKKKKKRKKEKTLHRIWIPGTIIFLAEFL